MPVLRAGLALVEPTLLFFPEAIVGHIGLRRNEATHLPEEYYFKMPTVPAQTPIFLLDPMLATGGSICATIERLHLEGFNNIAILAVIAAPEGIEKVLSHYPGTRIITASLDTALNDNAYIIPGLGDAGDRFFGTES
jgi:uracil phosphoribosyltransferase